MVPPDVAPRQTVRQRVPETDLDTAIRAANGGKTPTTQREVAAILRDAEVNTAMLAAADCFDMADPKHGFKHPRYPHKSAATPPGCMDRCTICALQWFGPAQSAKLGYERSLTDEEAAQQITELKTATANNLNYIRTFIDKYGNTVVRTWKKRSPEQRKDILRQAMPTIGSRKEFPLNEMFKFSGKFVRDGPTMFAKKHHKGLLLPYLNVEDLSQRANNLLALLYQRTRSKPVDCAPFDDLSLWFVFKAPWIRTSYNPHCVKMHGGQYGQLVPWQKDAAHSLDMIGFPKAFLVFQAQHELSIHLRGFVDSIVVKPLPTEIRGRDYMDTLALNDFIDGRDKARQNNWAVSYCSPPPKLDIQGIKADFRTRCQAAQDELWLMQTDPSYLRDHFSRFNGAMVFESGTNQEVRMWRSMIAMLPLAMWETWLRLYIDSEQACVMLKACKDPVEPGKPLPEQYEVAIAGLERALTEEFDAQCDRMATMIMCSSSFRQYCTGTENSNAVLNLLGRPIHETDPLFYHLLELAKYRKRVSYPASYHLRMLEQIMDNSKAQAARVDQLMHNLLSAMTAIDRILNVLRLHRPRSREFDQVRHLSEGDQYARRAKLFGISRENQRDNLHILCEPLESFLRIPAVPRKVNREALRTFDESHKAMQLFWKAVRERWSLSLWGYAYKQNMNPYGNLVDMIFDAISFSTTKEHLEWIAYLRFMLCMAIKAQEGKAAAARAEAEAKCEISSTPPQKVWGEEVAETFQPCAQKIKTRTRPSQQKSGGHDPVRDEVEAATEALEDLALRIQVDASSCDIFQQMYDTRSEQQRDTRWEDFVAAMIDAGFSVTPSGGSVSTFEHSASGGSINFHRPHPDPSIDPVMLRIMGKRLNKWFAFDKDTFRGTSEGRGLKEQRRKQGPAKGDLVKCAGRQLL